MRYCGKGRDRDECHWEESAKLTTRDRRGGDLFGTSLSLHHDTGVAIVGASGASLKGLWREVGSSCYDHRKGPSYFWAHLDYRPPI